jgi:hypothetical protein
MLFLRQIGCRCVTALTVAPLPAKPNLGWTHVEAAAAAAMAALVAAAATPSASSEQAHGIASASVAR